MVTPEKPIAPRRSMVAVSAMTMTVMTASARSGMARCVVEVCEPGWEFVPAGHGEGGAGDARDEVEEHTEGGDAGTDPTIGARSSNRDPSTTRSSGASLSRDRVDGDGGQQRDTDDRVDQQDAEEGARDRLGDGRGGVADLFAECGDAGVAGEGEEQESSRAQHSGRGGVDR